LRFAIWDANQADMTQQAIDLFEDRFLATYVAAAQYISAIRGGLLEVRLNGAANPFPEPFCIRVALIVEITDRVKILMARNFIFQL
jgi:hypothetical protein